jgi:hypothetical protein
MLSTVSVVPMAFLKERYLKFEHTFDALDFASSKASESPPMFGPGDSCRTDRTLEVRNWSTRRRATFTGSRGVRHFSLGLSFWREKSCYILQSRMVMTETLPASGDFYLII